MMVISGDRVESSRSPRVDEILVLFDVHVDTDAFEVSGHVFDEILRHSRINLRYVLEQRDEPMIRNRLRSVLVIHLM